MKEITIEESFRGHKLRTPLKITIDESKNELEKQVIQYVLETFIPRQPLLAKFTLENRSTMEVAKRLLLYGTRSEQTLYGYISSLQLFNKFVHIGLDQLVDSCKQQDFALKQQALNQVLRSIDQFIFAQQQANIAPATIASHVRYFKSFFRSNGIDLGSLYNLSWTPLYEDRAPTAEELQKVLVNAKLRERLMVTMMAVGGFRIGTLLALRYRHLKNDVEKNVVPVHVHVDASITKGKYHSYDTFLNEEAAEYLVAYLDARRRGTRRIPPEQITDISPVIRNYVESDKVLTITTDGAHRLIHELYLKAGIATLLPACEKGKSKYSRRYDVRTHSLRKFFRTELASRGVNRDYIEYMMGHKTDKYHDVKMKGVEFLRGIYLTAGISIRPKIKLDKIQTLKEIMRAWGLNPEEILNRNVLNQSSAFVDSLPT